MSKIADRFEETFTAGGETYKVKAKITYKSGRYTGHIELWHAATLFGYPIQWTRVKQQGTMPRESEEVIVERTRHWIKKYVSDAHAREDATDVSIIPDE